MTNFSWWISAKSVATGTTCLRQPAVLPNASIAGTLLKLVDFLTSSALHVVGHCALQSASTAPLVMLENPWKAVSKVSSTVFLPVLLTLLQAVMVSWTTTWSPVKFGVKISSSQLMPIWPKTQSTLETKSSKPWDLRLVTSHWNQWVLTYLELVSLSDLSTFYSLTLFIFNKEFISFICWSF